MIDQDGPRVLRILRVWGVVLLWVVLPLLTCEVYFRVYDARGVFTPATLREKQLVYEPAVYSRHVFPATPQSVRIHDAELRIGPLGYRGPAFDPIKPEGTTRIMFYGGSSVFNTGSTEGEDWPRQVEKLLRNIGYSNVEVINAGIPGHASMDAVGRLLAEGHLFTPDVVAYYGGWNDLKQFARPDPTLRQIRPAIRRDPRLYYQGNLDRFLCETSQVYVRLREKYWEREYDIGTEGAKNRSLSESQNSVNPNAQPDEHGIYQVHPRQFGLNLAAFVDIARNIGAVPLLIKQGRLVSADNDAAERARIRTAYLRLDHAGAVAGYAAIDREFERIAKEKDVMLIDGTKSLGSDLKFFRDHVHIRPFGAASLAAYVVSRLEPLLVARMVRVE